MYVVREVLSCNPGKVRPLLDRFKALNQALERMGERPFRLLTDVSGAPFWSLIAEQETDSLDGFIAMEGRVMADPAAREAMAGYHELVASGRREVYRLET